MTDTTSTPGAELEQLSPRTVELIDRLGIKFADPADVSLRIAERLSLATTPEELFNPDGPSGWRTREGEPFTVRSVEWLRGSYESGPGFYAVADVANTDGEPETLTCGATSVIIQLAKGMQEGWFKGRLVKLVRSKTPTADGYYPLKLIEA